MAGQGKAGLRLGLARQGLARLGMARQGGARQGTAWRGGARQGSFPVLSKQELTIINVRRLK